MLHLAQPPVTMGTTGFSFTVREFLCEIGFVCAVLGIFGVAFVRCLVIIHCLPTIMDHHLSYYSPSLLCLCLVLAYFLFVFVLCLFYQFLPNFES